YSLKHLPLKPRFFPDLIGVIKLLVRFGQINNSLYKADNRRSHHDKTPKNETHSGIADDGSHQKDYSFLLISQYKFMHSQLSKNNCQNPGKDLLVFPSGT